MIMLEEDECRTYGRSALVVSIVMLIGLEPSCTSADAEVDMFAPNSRNWGLKSVRAAVLSTKS